ncbi:MAG: hypothetical protein M3680_07370 [Myxococcota bacterium]|nr:hypothetical protein [Myxococcota bacterium]
MRIPSILSTALVLGTTACAGPAAEPTIAPPCHGKCDAPAGVTDLDGDGTSVCLAIRGNGPRLTAHFGAVSRMYEHYGLIDAVAGGSSGSITAFLVESVQANPALYRCGGSDCTRRQIGDRGAFLFKSLLGYFEVLSESTEALTFREVTTLANAVSSGNLEALLASDPQAGVQALQGLLASPLLRDALNPELGELLRNSPDPTFHARDLVATFKKGLVFEATEPTIFVRPGAVRFPSFIDRVGRIATFYAGYGQDPEPLAMLLDVCAPAARGKPWSDAARTPYAGVTCGDQLRSMIAAWRDRALADPSLTSRLDDSIGAFIPALVTTGVLEGAAVPAWRAARAAYLAASPVTLDVTYEDVGIGYWGAAGDLVLVTEATDRTDVKSRKRRSLGVATWRTALAASPAEPGLSRALELPEGRVSVGGWSDLQPVLVLEDLGCDNTVLLTRPGGAGGFETQIMGLLGSDAATLQAITALDDPRSSDYQAIEAAAGVWCSDWDAPPTGDLAAMTSIGYDAPFETKTPYFTTGDRYAGVIDRTGSAGCTLGVAP